MHDLTSSLLTTWCEAIGLPASAPLAVVVPIYSFAFLGFVPSPSDSIL